MNPQSASWIGIASHTIPLSFTASWIETAREWFVCIEVTKNTLESHIINFTRLQCKCLLGFYVLSISDNVIWSSTYILQRAFSFRPFNRTSANLYLQTRRLYLCWLPIQLSRFCVASSKHPRLPTPVVLGTLLYNSYDKNNDKCTMKDI